MANRTVKHKGQLTPAVHRPRRVLKQVWGDAWRNVVMMLCDKLPLVVALLLVFGVDALRRTLSGRGEGTVAHLIEPLLLVAELSLIVSLVLPKAILVVDEIVTGVSRILESVFVAIHRVWHAVRTGKRLAEDVGS
jgi:hypothetical protein